jgi:hypothetical protein
MRGLYLDQDGYLTVDISNPFGLPEKQKTVIIGDDEHVEVVDIYKLSNSTQESIIL